jgi:hypothetical protein
MPGLSLKNCNHSSSFQLKTRVTQGWIGFYRALACGKAGEQAYQLNGYEKPI